MKSIFITALLFVSMSKVSAAENLVVNHNLECLASGHSFRIAGYNSAEQWVDSRLALKVLKEKDSGSYVAKEFIGHVTLWKFLDKKKGYVPNFAEAEIYQIFIGENLAASLSPRAKSYPDSSYIRFNDFNSNVSIAQDGGGMNGTLVISKTPTQASTPQIAKYDAHYIFQHGDHTGGTIDYMCTGIR